MRKITDYEFTTLKQGFIPTTEKGLAVSSIGRHYEYFTLKKQTSLLISFAPLIYNEQLLKKEINALGYDITKNFNYYQITKMKGFKPSRKYNNLKSIMEGKGITLEDIAKTVGKTMRTVKDKLNGKHKWSTDECLAIKEEFFNKYPVMWLFEKE